MQTGAVVFGGVWAGWVWFPGEIPDGPEMKSLQNPDSNSQGRHMPNRICCFQVRLSKPSP